MIWKWYLVLINILVYLLFVVFCREVVEGDEFLSLSSDQVIKLISSDELTVPSEEKVKNFLHIV